MERLIMHGKQGSGYRWQRIPHVLSINREDVQVQRCSQTNCPIMHWLNALLTKTFIYKVSIKKIVLMHSILCCAFAWTYWCLCYTWKFELNKTLHKCIVRQLVWEYHWTYTPSCRFCLISDISNSDNLIKIH